MSIRQIVLAALTAALSAGPSGGARAADGRARGQCLDLAQAGQHVCAGPSADEHTPGEWAYVAKGVR
ncbi:hypothetical protein ACFJIX_25035 [Roseateles sp. UC29_93]|uniref:hypothetical protein n=1 Tax=Roseateles sp. UC29_93 TaxID=3350177 RepID=UPI0002DF63F7